MSRRYLIPSDAEPSGRLTSIDLARARLFDVDVDRKKRIDDTIDYFGGRDPAAERDPCGEA